MKYNSYIKKLKAKLVKQRPYSNLGYWVQIATIAGVISSLLIGSCANRRASLDTELANRPFVSIENACWLTNSDGSLISARIQIKNYGNKPAEEFAYRNFRTILFVIDTKNIEEKIREKMDKNLEPHFQGYLIDYKNKLYLELMQVLSDYFKSHLDINHLDLVKYLSTLTCASSELKGKSYLVYKEKLLFYALEVNPDMDDYYNKQYRLVFPNKPEEELGLNEAISPPGIKSVLEGDNLLVAYWAIKYKGFNKNKEYSTFFLGYDYRENETPHLFKQFRSWIDEN